MRNIIGTVKLVAKYFPGSPETVTDVLQVEIQLRARELFREGLPVAGAYAVILQELPDSISSEDKAGVLKIVVDSWREFKVEGGGKG